MHVVTQQADTHTHKEAQLDSLIVAQQQHYCMQLMTLTKQQMPQIYVELVSRFAHKKQTSSWESLSETRSCQVQAECEH